MLSGLEFDADTSHVNLGGRIEAGIDTGGPAVAGSAGTDFRIHSVISCESEEVLSGYEEP